MNPEITQRLSTNVEFVVRCRHPTPAGRNRSSVLPPCDTGEQAMVNGFQCREKMLSDTVGDLKRRRRHRFVRSSFPVGPETWFVFDYLGANAGGTIRRRPHSRI